jgi:hypothetical protein
MNRISRRRLLGQGGALLCACRAGARVAFGAGHAAPADASALKERPYSAVELSDGPMREQFEAQQRLFLSIDDDKLLKPNEPYRLYNRLAS